MNKEEFDKLFTDMFVKQQVVERNMVVYVGEEGRKMLEKEMDKFCTGLILDMNAKKFETEGYNTETLKEGLFSSDSAVSDFSKDVINGVVDKKQLEDEVFSEFIGRLDDSFFPEFKHIREKNSK